MFNVKEECINKKAEHFYGTQWDFHSQCIKSLTFFGFHFC